MATKLDEDAEIKEIKQLDTDVEALKQQSGKILEEIGQAQNDPEAKSPQVLAKKLKGMIQGLEEEIDKIEKEKGVTVEKEKTKEKDVALKKPVEVK
jgi:GTP cyclohydrolase I